MRGCPKELMVSIVSFKCSSIENDVNFVNYGPISSQIDRKAAYALGCGHLVIDMSLPGNLLIRLEDGGLKSRVNCLKPAFFLKASILSTGSK